MASGADIKDVTLPYETTKCMAEEKKPDGAAQAGSTGFSHRREAARSRVLARIIAIAILLFF